MSVNLVKGGKVKLTKDDGVTALTAIMVGLGWDAKQTGANGAEFDLDASVYMVNKDGRVSPVTNFVFFNNLKSPCGSVEHTGDNLTGDGDGDDEQIKIDLSKVPADIDKLVVVVNIFEADSRGQNFGMVENSFVRLLDMTGGEKEAIHFDLNFDASTATGVKFATIFRKGDTWAFSADQVEFSGGLEALNTEYGI